MPITVRVGDDGEIEGAWEVPIERYTLTIWCLFIGPLAGTIPLGLVVRDRLSVSQQRFLGLLLAPPLLIASGLLGWRLGGTFWPSRSLSDEEITEWRSRGIWQNQEVRRRESARMDSSEMRYWLGWGLSLVGTILRQTSGYRKKSPLARQRNNSLPLSAGLYLLPGLLLLTGYLRQRRGGRRR